MEQLNLQSQNLTIHYFSFNISGSLQKEYLRKIASYLFESFGFNATFKRDQFYDYNFPFQFNHYFLHWKNIQHFEVKTQLIQILGQTTIKKKLDVQQFMKPFDKLSNLKKTTVKKILIESIEQEIQNKFLQPKFKIIQRDNSVKYLEQIKPINITKARFIFFYENIHIRDLFKQI